MLRKISWFVRIAKNFTRPRPYAGSTCVPFSTRKNVQWENEKNRLLAELNLHQPEEQNDKQWMNRMSSEDDLVRETSLRFDSGAVSASDILYVVNQMEDETNIVRLLKMMAPLAGSLPDTELLQFYQKILAYKPAINLSVPVPRKVKNLELLLFCLSEVHPGSSLMGWLEQILYVQVENSLLPLIAMAFFNILSKMNQTERQIHRQLLDKISYIVESRASAADYETYLAILIISLQLQYPQAEKLLRAQSLEISEMTIFQIAQLFININLYEGTMEANLLKKINDQLLQELIETDWDDFIKVTIFVRLWRVASKTQKSSIFKIFTQKLISFSSKQHEKFKFDDMTTGEVVTVIECIESLMINNKKLMYFLLRRLQLELRKMPKQQIFRLTCCLVTYVRQFQEFFVQLRKVCQERKAEWTKDQINKLNKVFDRCRILFRKPLYLGPNLIKISQSAQSPNEIIGTITEDTRQYVCSMPVRIGCRREISVSFIVDTGSPHTYLSKQTFRLLLAGSEAQIPSYGDMTELTVWGLAHPVYMSSDNFSELNLLGTDFLEKHWIDLRTSQSDKTFRLTRGNP